MVVFFFVHLLQPIRLLKKPFINKNLSCQILFHLTICIQVSDIDEITLVVSDDC